MSVDTKDLGLIVYDMNLVEFNGLPLIEIEMFEEGQTFQEGVLQWNLGETDKRVISSLVDDIVDCVLSHGENIESSTDEYGEWSLYRGVGEKRRISVVVIDGCVLFLERIMDWSGHFYYVYYRDCLGNFWTNINEEFSWLRLEEIREYFEELYQEYW